MLLLLQHPLAEGYSRGEYLGNPALHQFGLGQLRVLQLVADGNLVAGTHQFGKILGQGVMGDARHRGVALLAVGFAGEHYPQHLAGDECVVAV